MVTCLYFSFVYNVFFFLLSSDQYSPENSEEKYLLMLEDDQYNSEGGDKKRWCFVNKYI